MKKGKLIVIDGLDGSGKSTQQKLLVKNLRNMGLDVKGIEFPDYDMKASALIKMYLAGDFGTTADEVNPYAASSFYTTERYASFKTIWEKDYNQGTIIISARYTSSNMFHQMSKLNKEKWNDFLDWLVDFEYNKIGIPKPDKTIFLDMDIEVSKKLILKRYGGNKTKRDIHEEDFNYLKRCQEAALYSTKKFSFDKLVCSRNGIPLEVEKVQQMIMKSVINILK